MIVQFNNDYLEAIFIGNKVNGKPKYSIQIINKFKKTVQILEFTENINQLKKINGLNFESLKGDLEGYYSVRINDAYRMILSVIEENFIEIVTIEDLTNHYQ